MSDGNAITDPPLLECRRITKRFGGVVVLDAVDFTLRRGEIHGLVGSNGAGKSTLMKILAGVLPDHDGTIRIDGHEVEFPTPLAAREHGVAMVYQELSGIEQLSVAENLFLGRQPTTRFGRIDWRGMRRQAREQLRAMQIGIDVNRPLESFPLVIRQMVEIARGLHSHARILILDEPTSALSPPETRRLFTLLRRLKEQGVAVVFISHFIEDVLEICDRVTILKDGRRLETSESADLDKHYVIHTMLGHRLDETEIGYEAAAALPPRTEVPPVLRAEKLSCDGAFHNVSLDLSPGECLGLYGFVGAGHQDLVHVLAGAKRAARGSVAIDGQTLPSGNIHRAVQQGVVMVAADRAQTLVRVAEIYKNVTMAHLKSSAGNWLMRQREIAVCRPLLERVGCRPADPVLPAGHLSGGNQQKVVMAKWLLGPVRVLLLEEPTRGMDVGAKAEIMEVVARLKRDGTAVLLASTEPELLLAHADRIVTFHRGTVTREFSGCSVDKSDLMRFAQEV